MGWYIIKLKKTNKSLLLNMRVFEQKLKQRQ